MYYILCFIGGIFCCKILAPISDKLLEVILLWLESCKSKSQKRILNSNKEMIMLNEFLEEPEEQPDYDVMYLDGDDDDD
jgi:hypothetical protein